MCLSVGEGGSKEMGDETRMRMRRCVGGRGEGIFSCVVAFLFVSGRWAGWWLG